MEVACGLVVASEWTVVVVVVVLNQRSWNFLDGASGHPQTHVIGLTYARNKSRSTLSREDKMVMVEMDDGLQEEAKTNISLVVLGTETN
jgi:hypothetical protein